MGSFRGDRSGQIIVVAALLLAVVFVGLALVLNSAIYAENLATRGETTTGEAMAVDTLTADHLQAAVDAENYGIEEDSYAARRSRLETNVSDWNDVLGPKEARTGNDYSVELAGMTNGTRVNQSNPDRDFKPANSNLLDVDPLGLGGDANWQIAAGSDLRAFEMTVRRDSLYETDSDLSTEIEQILDNVLTGSDRFWAEFQGDTTHRVYLMNDGVNGSVAAVVTEYDYSDDSEQKVGVCSVEAPDPSDYVTVRITGAELEGPEGATECEALESLDENKQDAYYAGSDHAVGTYRFIADDEEEEFRSSLTVSYDSIIDDLTDLSLTDLSQDAFYADSPTDQDPYTTKSVYGITAESTYRDGRITYVRNTTYPPTAR